MLTIYRRHLKSCEHRKKGREYRRCKCPIWVDGLIGTLEIRKSLRMRDWDKAQALVREWEVDGSLTEHDSADPVTIIEACDTFIRDAKARGLASSTLKKYGALCKELKSFSAGCGVRFIGELDVPRLGEFRSTWKDHNLSALKKLEHLCTFFNFAVDAGWLPTNPAKKLRKPKISRPPTMPFTPERVRNLLAACEKLRDGYGRSGMENAQRMRALILLLRHSGLRVGDAWTLERDRIENGRLFLYTSKTGVHVFCPLPKEVISVLESVPNSSPQYFFWTGKSKRDSAARNAAVRLKKVFRLAGIPDGHAHQFRDTFAVELLLSGVPMERVSMLLGHSSVRITERYYAPWIRARQEQLEEDVKASWLSPRSNLDLAKGTYEVHGKSSLVN